MRWSWPTIEVGCEVSQGAFAEPLLYQNNLPGFGVPAPATAPESLLREHFIWIIMEDDDPMVITITQPLIQPVIDAFISPSITRNDDGVVLGKVASELAEYLAK